MHATRRHIAEGIAGTRAPIGALVDLLAATKRWSKAMTRPRAAPTDLRNVTVIGAFTPRAPALAKLILIRKRSPGRTARGGRLTESTESFGLGAAADA